MLDKSLEGDAALRAKLKQKTIERMLDCQQLARERGLVERRCLFCKEILSGPHMLLFQHMRDAHDFNIGLPDNMVHIDDFLDLLQVPLHPVVVFSCIFIVSCVYLLK